MSFAANLKTAMDERQMTQAQLSALTGIGKPSISQYLSGKNVPLNRTVEKLAEALETTVDFLTNEHTTATKDELRNVPVELAARLLGKSRQFVRVSLQRGVAPFGFAVKGTGEKWSYHISPKKLNEYISS